MGEMRVISGLVSALSPAVFLVCAQAVAWRMHPLFRRQVGVNTLIAALTGLVVRHTCVSLVTA